MIRELLLKLLGAVDKKQIEEKFASQMSLVSEKNEEICKLQSSKQELQLEKDSTAQKFEEKLSISKKELDEAQNLAEKFEKEKITIENDFKARLQELVNELNKANETIKNQKGKIDQVCSEFEKAKEENKALLNSQEPMRHTLEEKKSEPKVEKKDENAELKYTQGKLQQLIRELSETKKELKDAKEKLQQIEQTKEQQKLAEDNKDNKQQTINQKSASVESKPSNAINGTGGQKKEEDKKFSKPMPDLKISPATSVPSKDLPSPETIYRPTIRNIKAVIDLERNDEFIKADEFFSRGDEEISKVSRHLEMCAQLGKASMICACCYTPVKISKRTTSKGEGLFFTHCNHQVNCQWRPVHASGDPSFSEVSYTPLNMAQQAKVNSFKKDREIISNALTSNTSKSLGINAEIDVFPVNNIPHVSKRKTDFFCTLNNSVKLAINLQTSANYNSDIVSKDIFYKLNGYFILWVFGAGEENYNYLKKLDYKNTLYANKRNVFIFDKEAREATKRNDTLVLKCNYLDPDGKWHYRQNTTGNNGILINLDDLHYDDMETNRPYYHNANIEFFQAYPQEEPLAKNKQKNREQLQMDVENNWKVEQEYVSKESDKAGNPPTDTTDSALAMSQTSDSTDIEDETKVNVPNNDIEASKSEEDTQPSIEPKTVYDELIELKDGFAKFKQNGKWGILKDGGVIIEPYYDEIGSFRNRFVGIYNGLVTKIINQQNCDTIRELEYHYRSTIKAKFVEDNQNEWIFEVCGESKAVKGIVSKNGYSRMKQKPKRDEFYDLTILSIVYQPDTSFLILGVVTSKLLNRPYDHTDKAIDFKINGEYNGTIIKKKGNKFYVNLDNGGVTYFTRSSLGSQQADNVQHGDHVLLKKIGFDDKIEKTIWEVTICSTSKKMKICLPLTEGESSITDKRLGKSYTFRIRKDGKKYYGLVEQNERFIAHLPKTGVPTHQVGDLICAKIKCKIKGTGEYLAEK